MQGWREFFNDGQVIPACPLALHSDGSWSQRHQRALLRYYVAAGAGGVAVGVHSTQFEIRDSRYGLFEPLLKMASQTLDEASGTKSFIKIAGICGTTSQANREAEFARETGYHAGLLSLTALKDASVQDLIRHCRHIADTIPVIGFYLQPAVGGRVLDYSFWRKFCDIEAAVAVKMAPFNRYQTWDVVRAVIESGREDVALYTGNDDNIINDLLTPFCYNGMTRFIVGGLLGQWGVWTHRAVEMLNDIKSIRGTGSIPSEWLSRNVALTDINAAVFDAANGFAGCIPGINEILYRQGLVPSNRCLNENEVLSDGQCGELNRVVSAYPHMNDDEFVSRHLDQWLDD